MVSQEDAMESSIKWKSFDSSPLAPIAWMSSLRYKWWQDSQADVEFLSFYGKQSYRVIGSMKYVCAFSKASIMTSDISWTFSSKWPHWTNFHAEFLGLKVTLCFVFVSSHWRVDDCIFYCATKMEKRGRRDQTDVPVCGKNHWWVQGF